MAGKPLDHRGEGGLVQGRGHREPHRAPDEVEGPEALHPRPGDEEHRGEARAGRHEGPRPEPVEPPPDRHGRQGRDTQAHREGPGDRHPRSPEIALHGLKEDRKAVVDDPPRDGLGDGQRRDDGPAVMETLRAQRHDARPAHESILGVNHADGYRSDIRAVTHGPPARRPRRARRR